MKCKQCKQTMPNNLWKTPICDQCKKTFAKSIQTDGGKE